MLYNKKILTQVKEHTTKKAKCLANKLDTKGKDVWAKEISCLAADAQVAFLPAI